MHLSLFFYTWISPKRTTCFCIFCCCLCCFSSMSNLMCKLKMCILRWMGTHLLCKQYTPNTYWRRAADGKQAADQVWLEMSRRVTNSGEPAGQVKNGHKNQEQHGRRRREDGGGRRGHSSCGHDSNRRSAVWKRKFHYVTWTQAEVICLWEVKPVWKVNQFFFAPKQDFHSLVMQIHLCSQIKNKPGPTLDKWENEKLTHGEIMTSVKQTINIKWQRDIKTWGTETTQCVKQNIL